MKIIFSVYVSPNFIFFLFIISSLSCNFNRGAVCFQSFSDHRLQEYSNAARIKLFWRLHIDKTIK